MYISEKLPVVLSEDPSPDQVRPLWIGTAALAGFSPSHPLLGRPKKTPPVKRNGARLAAYERTSSAHKSLNPTSKLVRASKLSKISPIARLRRAEESFPLRKLSSLLGEGSAGRELVRAVFMEVWKRPPAIPEAGGC